MTTRDESSSPEVLARLQALVAQWKDPDWWAAQGCQMDSQDAAEQLAALLPVVAQALHERDERIDRETELRRIAERDVRILTGEAEKMEARIPYANEYDQMQQAVTQAEARVQPLREALLIAKAELRLVYGSLSTGDRLLGVFEKIDKALTQASPGTPSAVLGGVVSRVVPSEGDSGQLQRLRAAVLKSRCEYCGYMLSCPRSAKPCEICADRVAILREGK